MPPPRKIDLIPTEIRLWLQEALKQRGFSGYVELTDELNTRLAERGEAITVGKSAVHNFGQEYEAFARAQEEASAWAVSWMEDNGLEDEAKRQSVLFQMMTTLAFKAMKSRMEQEGEDINPQELHFLGRMMKDLMSSSGMREKLKADEEKRIAEQAVQQAKAEMQGQIDDAEKDGSIDVEAAQKAREIMGFA